MKKKSTDLGLIIPSKIRIAVYDRNLVRVMMF